MSWFDATGLATIAKTALKEAQRTIDKALDIKEERNAVPANTPIDPNSEDFFGSWGVTQPPGTTKDVDENSKNAKLSSSIWGSFTGSFFDAGKEYDKSLSVDSLDDTIDGGHDSFKSSKLVVQHSEEDLSSDGNSADKSTSSSSFTDIDIGTPRGITEDKDSVSVHDKYECKIVSSKQKEDSKNSESVELITCNTECTTSPESEVLSVCRSVSSSSSTQGIKQTSESVEILQDSLTSPSSVEILSSESSGSRPHQPDEPPSPTAHDAKPSSKEKLTPDSVEVIPEDQEDTSIAEEDTMSYTSISESTSATVLDSNFNMHLKPQKMLKDTYNESEVSSSPEKNYVFTDAITRAPSRNSMHLPLHQVNEVLIDTQPQSTMQEMPIILKNSNVIDIPPEGDVISHETSTEDALDVSNDEGWQSDKTLKACDNNMESSSDTSITESNSNLKNMLADAMTDKSSEKSLSIKSGHFMDLTQSMIDSSQSANMLENISISQLDMPPRENSPISSESRSDLVKIGSDHTSGHTSGDELETTTSSDIEIISSPNGDSSSTQSRQSPAKQSSLSKVKEDCHVDSLLCKMTMKKAKGHNRELSEASSISDDSHSSEVDRLIKRISEMTEILESRESKIIDMNRRNMELQEQNNSLKQQIDSIITKQLESQDLSQVTEEYTQRLSSLEKKFQQVIREKDTLRKQLEQSKLETANRMSKGDLEAIISEKDEMVTQLREEGEKLSKQQLQHSNIIKKLRAKEKENEATIKHLKEKVENFTVETERLKRSLTAKEEVERTQIDAVHQLTAKNKKLESEVDKLRSELDDMSKKHETVKKSLEAAKKELIDKHKANSELHAREQLIENLQNQKKITESQNEEIVNQLEHLRSKLLQSETENARKEQLLKNENAELLRRLEDAEARNEELSQSVLEVSKPLVRQLESLQATHNMKMAHFDKVDQELTLKINDLQTRLQSAITSERSAKDEMMILRNKLAELESHANLESHQNQMLKMKLEQANTEKQLAVQELQSKITELEENLKVMRGKIEEQSKEITILEHRLTEHSIEIERKKSSVQEPSHENVDKSSSNSRSNSPTLSFGKASVASMGSFWSQDETFDVAQPPRYTNMFEMQMLQSNLKQREGEVQQLQWELNRREQERSLLNSEISTLLTKIENLTVASKDLAQLKTQFDELQKQYDTLCQLYGEKVEENEELKLDLLDVKDAYKSQIDELLKQTKEKS